MTMIKILRVGAVIGLLISGVASPAAANTGQIFEHDPARNHPTDHIVTGEATNSSDRDASDGAAD
jgi:hypothetical protein